MGNYREIKFKCPTCGGTEIEEVIENAVALTPLVSIEMPDADEEGGRACFEYGDVSLEDGDFVRFQCCGCGRLLAESEDDLADVLKTNGWLGDPVEPVNGEAADISPDTLEDAVREIPERRSV